jgi:hypothetical protein
MFKVNNVTSIGGAGDVGGGTGVDLVAPYVTDSMDSVDCLSLKVCFVVVKAPL